MKTKGWTYGAEHEFGDWYRPKGIPKGFSLDERDITMVNSNGIAVDSKGTLYPYGGEFNTPPTSTPAGQVECLLEILRMHPDCAVNYRSNLHIHVRVPGLKDDLILLKSLSLFNELWARKVLPLIEPIPEPTKIMYVSAEAYEGARRRYRRRRKSHQTCLPPRLHLRQLTAKDTEAFHALGVPWSKAGKPLPYCQPRCAVNVRQLLETNTIEFRHFPGTLNGEELLSTIEWCRDYLKSAFDLNELSPITRWYRKYMYREWPSFEPYQHWMEVRYRATVHDGSISKQQIIDNIKRFVKEDGNEDPRAMSR